MDVLIPLILYGLCGAVAIYLCGRSCSAQERHSVLWILISAFVLRLSVATMFSIFPQTRMFHDDADGYELVGMKFAAYWSGHGPPIIRDELVNQGYFYISGAAAYLAAGSRYAAAFLNTVLGTVTIFLVYRLARQFFHPRIAQRAAACCAFFPSMVLWSSIAVKDTIMTLLIVISVSGCIRLKRRFSTSALLMTVLPVIASQPIRFYMVYFLLFSIIASLLIERRGRALTGIPKMVAIAGGVVVLIALVGLAGRAEADVEMLSLKNVSHFRYGMAVSANSGFSADVDLSTPQRAIAFMPIGLTMLLFSPFPWQFTSLRALFALPEMLVWWALVPALVRGLRFAIRTRFAECSPILLFAVTLAAGYSLMQGNVGAGFRQRAQIFVFLFIFSALGQYVKRCTNRGVSPAILLDGNRMVAASAR